MASKLYVGGLSYATTSESLREYFAQCGSVLSARVITDQFSGQSRGFGFVEMSTEAEAQEAIQRLNDQSFEGRRLKVDLAKPQAAGSRTGNSGFGSGRGAGRTFGGDRRSVRW